MSETQEAVAAAEEQDAPAVEEAAPPGEADAPDGAADDGSADGAEAAPEEEVEPDPAVPVAVGPAAGRQARVFLCDRGHRTVAVWSAPSVCHARPVRSGPECGRQLHPIGNLPDQVQKALNPLKASKKASKKA